jgi:hypothetical protein
VDDFEDEIDDDLRIRKTISEVEKTNFNQFTEIGYESE